MMEPIDPDCMSTYLALRYVPWRDKAWRPGVAPQLPERHTAALTRVATADEIRGALTLQLAAADPQTTGLLLSGGIDSAILAAMLPADTRTYTIRFVAQDAIDESEQAAAYARSKGLQHRVVEVTWQDYLQHTAGLMRHKRAPLHAIEVALHKAALVARADGVDTLIVGNGADSNFGGMDKLLSRDWSFDAFVARYTFVDPARVLTAPRSVRSVFAPYRHGELADVVRFLHEVHGPGIVQAFENAITSAGCRIIAPYE
ncbi:MAG TPA: asparagine synthase-related protein, partial [Polyangiales bacterium]|nr:asparagine synthase-related protein [Polyangiales bacterium]